jgi:hypothetical protein
MLGTILIIILILLVVGALPTWGYSSGWGYYPGGTLCPVATQAKSDNATAFGIVSKSSVISCRSFC